MNMVITINFFALRTLQHIGVAERKNRTLEEMAKTMLITSCLSMNFWAEAINTVCYILNRVLIRPITSKHLMNSSKGINPNIFYFRVFGFRCFVHVNGKRN